MNEISGFGSSFISEFNRIEEGENIERSLEDMLKTTTLRAAFLRFANEHSDLISKSPLMQHAFAYAKELDPNGFTLEDSSNLQSGALKATQIKVRNLSGNVFEQNIVNLENQIFKLNRKQLPDDLDISQIEHIFLLHDAGLLKDEMFLEFLSKQNTSEKSPLYKVKIFQAALPQLQTLAEKKPELLVQFLSKQDKDESTILHKEKIFLAALPLLQNIARKAPKLLVTLLELKDKFESTPLHGRLDFQAVLPLLQILVQKEPESITHLLFKRNVRNVSPIHNVPINDHDEFINKLIETNPVLMGDLFLFGQPYYMGSTPELFNRVLSCIRSLPANTPIPPKLAALMLSRPRDYLAEVDLRERLNNSIKKFLTTTRISKEQKKHYAELALNSNIFEAEEGKFIGYLRFVTGIRRTPETTNDNAL